MKKENRGIIFLTVFWVVWMPLMGFGAEKPPATGRRADFGIRFQDYQWAEYDNDNHRILEETGGFYGFFYDIEVPGQVIGWRTGLNAFIGQVDYDGQTWTNLPVTTDGFYTGVKMYVDMVPGYRTDAGLHFKPFAGFGTELWLRDLDDTRTSTGDPVRGTREWWGVIYGRLGLGAEYPIASVWVVFAEAGVKIPVYARNQAQFYISGDPSLALEPEPDFSGFGNVGLWWKAWGMKVSYDSLRFDRSDVASTGFYSFYQPKSKANLYSLDVFWSKAF